MRALRDHRVLNKLIRAPFSMLRQIGVELPRELTQHLTFHGPFEVRLPGGACITMLSHGHSVENQMYWHRLEGHEPESVWAWIRLARDARSTLDIGANTGLFALIAAAVGRGSRVHAFEPVPRIAQLCRTNFGLNPTLSLSLHEVAVGAEDGVAELFDPGGDHAYSASLDPGFLPRDDRTSYPVSVVSIDSFVERAALDTVDLVKLDVEGFECEALEGMKQTISRWTPTLVVELLSSDNLELIARLDALRRSLGYQFFHLDRSGPVLTETISPTPGAHNVLLHHPSRGRP
ncbi:MAG: FkbM family methyltransferase [Deltaproteobacteria bacterium]|nr:FkbM family methyltransferase [Deltaproteobacteria bacterium]